MKVKVISEIKKFHELQKDWNALFNTKKHTVFQSFLFNYYSWKFELNNVSKEFLEYQQQQKAQQELLKTTPVQLTPFYKKKLVKMVDNNRFNYLFNSGFIKYGYKYPKSFRGYT